jgi:hypothetical protein
VELAEAFDDPGVLLGHDVDRLEDEDQRDDEEDQGDSTEGEFHEHPL